jgi:glutathione S-transferase
VSAAAGTVELVVFTPAESDRLMNYSLFCVKAEALLRLAKIPYRRTEFSGNPASLPKGKLPMIRHGGKDIPDSYFIGEYLKSLPGYSLDQGLSDQQHADAFAYVKMGEEFLYWAVLSERWLEDANWANTRNIYFGNIPALIRGPVTSLIRKGAVKSARAHGMGRHSPEERFQLGERCLKALSARLSSHPFISGDKPSGYDAAIYGFLVNILDCPQINPRLNAAARKLPALVEYCDRLYALLKA